MSDSIQGATPSVSGYPAFVPSHSVSTSGGYPSRETIARSLYAVTNHILRSKLWDGWEPQPLEEDPAAREAHYAYADVVLALIANLTNSQWKPISTAPRDGSWLLGYSAEGIREEAVWMLRWLQPNPDPVSAFWADDEWVAWEPTHWMPLPLAPGMEAEGQDRHGLGSKTDSPIAESEAPVNSLMLPALKAMDAALTEDWGGPDHDFHTYIPGEDFRKAWIQIRSAIAPADGGGKDERR